MEVLSGSIYDYPQYYDLLFGADWRAEYRFLLACFAKHARRPVRHLFEPACGTGRLLVKFAAAGYAVAGNDLNPKAVAYCNARFQRRGFPPTVALGDMADFRLARPADAAFNMINSFRHLPTERSAEAHLQAMAAAIAPGGMYALGLHLTPTAGRPIDEELWTASRGSLTVNSRMWTAGLDPRRRREDVAMTLDVVSPRRQFRLSDRMVFRTYTAAQFRRLLATAKAFEVVETYDFGYDIQCPVRVGPRTQDVVWVLRRL